MRHDLWRSILRAFDDIDRMVEQAAGGSVSGQSSVQAATAPAERADGASGAMAALHERVRERLATLRGELADAPAREHAMLALIIAIDERIMHMLPEELRLSWPLLQLEWLGSADGGDAFYRIIDEVLGDASTPSFLFEVFYFCLGQGFVGRWIGDPDAIASYQARLRTRIAVPEQTASQSTSSSSAGGGARVRSPVWYYLSTAAVVVLMTVLMVAISNCST